MSQSQFNPNPGVSTHQDALNIWNANATDAENRISALEAVTGEHADYSADIASLQLEGTQQTISSSAGVLTLDINNGHSADTTLTEDITSLVISNSTSGDSGLIVVKQDNTAGWTFSTSQDVLVGDLADIATITASGSGVATIGWYDDGANEYLYVSNFT